MPICDASQIGELGTILAVWAHPDDETFCAGGILATAILAGQTVVCVTATRGEAGVQDEQRWPADTLGAVRTRELKQALDVLGITKHHYLGYLDGLCAKADKEGAITKLSSIIARYTPATILTFGPDGLTGHPDHKAVSGWVSGAVAQQTERPAVYHAVVTVDQYRDYLSTAHQRLNLFYNIDQPPLELDEACDICFRCTNELCNCKFNAFLAMPSQFETMHKTLGEEFLKEAFRVEAFVRAY